MDEKVNRALDEENEQVELIATKDTLALVGFVLSLIGFLSGLVPPVAWPLDVAGAVFCIMGLKSVHWKGFAIAGLILAGLGFLGTTGLYALGLLTNLSGGSGAG